MASSRSYSQYPEPQEASGPPLKKEEDNNPIMRGITLVIGATLYVICRPPVRDVDFC